MLDDITRFDDSSDETVYENENTVYENDGTLFEEGDKQKGAFIHECDA